MLKFVGIRVGAEPGPFLKRRQRPRAKVYVYIYECALGGVACDPVQCVAPISRLAEAMLVADRPTERATGYDVRPLGAPTRHSSGLDAAVSVCVAGFIFVLP